jgi:sec-independent protein translocase protein TatC
LTLFGIVTPKFLIQNTKYAVLVITVVAAVVTPTPDAVTMLLVMGVMTVLYFIGVAVSWVVVRRRDRQAAEARS